jgi:hypothetical protein
MDNHFSGLIMSNQLIGYNLQNIVVTFSDYYLFSTPLQTLTYSAYLPKYNLYSPE